MSLGGGRRLACSWRRYSMDSGGTSLLLTRMRSEQLLGKLDQSAKLRSQWLQQLGLKASADDWENLVLKQQDPSLTVRFQALNDSIKNCRELNEVNGRLIGRSQQTLAKLLNIMRGTQATPQLYGSDGSTQNRSESRCFTQA